MIKAKRILCIALALLMLLPLLVACKKNGGEDAETTEEVGGADTQAPSADVADETTTGELLRYDEDGYLMDDLDLKGVNLEGKEFIILTGSPTRYCIDPEDIGTTMNTAIYNRHMAVTVRLNCVLTYVQETDGWEHRSSFIQKAQGMLTGEGVDLFAVYSLTTSAMMIQGLLQDLHKSEILDFNKPWWNSQMVDGCTILDRMYFCSGDIDYQVIGQSMAYLYNKNVASSANVDNYINTTWGVEDVYALVKEDMWTYDKMMDIAKTAGINTDGTKDGGDTFGYAGNFVMTDSFYQGCGMKQLATGADGSVMISSDHNSAKAGEVMTKLLDFLKDPNVYCESSFDTISGVSPWNLWKAGQVLFYHGAVTNALSDQTFDQGILPCPKYDEEQESYLTIPGFGYHMWAIARGTKGDFEDMCAVMEGLASEGYRKTNPTYFDTMLSERQETANDYDMLQIIRAGIVIDGGRVMDNAFDTNTWSVWRRCVMGNRDYLAYYAGYAEDLTEQAASLNSLMRNMEKLYS
ncbi:MAG: hypothetical protein E7668_04485 [Ruminococcaceae bacterium]|nr:hypothetical protein [Oscillospiraceae bacterium]